jgi:hypothetical protein
MSRYNRVEGFSTGLLVDQQLGAGYSATAIGRFGFSDHVPNVELSLARTNLSKTIRINGYNRLVSVNDWGNPLTFSSSVSTFLFGRDEGFYYRASGAELLWTTERGVRLDWRAFAERPALSGAGARRFTRRELHSKRRGGERIVRRRFRAIPS